MQKEEASRGCERHPWTMISSSQSSYGRRHTLLTETSEESGLSGEVVALNVKVFATHSRLRVCTGVKICICEL